MASSAYTGARRGEVLALRWSDVHLETRSVTIARSLTDAISETLCAILSAHRAKQAEERRALGAAYRDRDLVFARAERSPINPWNYGRAVGDLIRRSGVTPITLHGLRDTHASLWAKAGLPLEVVSQRLGHASIGITAERYLHVYSDRNVDAADAFGEARRLETKRAPLLHFCCTEPEYVTKPRKIRIMSFRFGTRFAVVQSWLLQMLNHSQ